MKVLFAAVFTSESTNTSQADGLERNGCQVIRFPYRDLARKIGNHNMDIALVELCKHEKPDVVIFSKCFEIGSWAVEECNKYSKTVLWYMDPIDNNYNSVLEEKIQLCDLVFCALTEPYEKAKRLGGDKVHFLQEGYDHLCNYPMDVPKKYNYSFIGNLKGERKDYYDSFPFTVIQDAYAEKHSEVVSQTKINLNFTIGGTSDRTYKILASRGFLLTQPWPGMEKDFTPGKDLVVFNSLEELQTLGQYYLENKEERTMIAYQGYETNKKFSRVAWAQSMLAHITRL
jgi:spore maturation protein CgeB